MTKLGELSEYFPANMEIVYPYDTTPFVKISIEEVVQTPDRGDLPGVLRHVSVLAELPGDPDSDHRGARGPARHLRVMAAFGFSINTLTMFGLVLAIGLLVDDAIVVVENVERLMSEEGLSPSRRPAGP